MNTQHTPGPWRITTVPTTAGSCHKIGPFPSRGGAETHACLYADGIRVGVDDGLPLSEELRANARLIAAAPELLDALKQALRYLEVTKAYNGHMTAAEVEAAISAPGFPSRVEIGAHSANTLASFDFVAARAAIAKASGGSA